MLQYSSKRRCPTGHMYVMQIVHRFLLTNTHTHLLCHVAPVASMRNADEERREDVRRKKNENCVS